MQRRSNYRCDVSTERNDNFYQTQFQNIANLADELSPCTTEWFVGIYISGCTKLMNTIFFCLLLSDGVCLWRLWKLHWIENVVENNAFIDNLISNIYAILTRGFSFGIMKKWGKYYFGRKRKKILVFAWKQWIDRERTFAVNRRSYLKYILICHKTRELFYYGFLYAKLAVVHITPGIFKITRKNCISRHVKRT